MKVQNLMASHLVAALAVILMWPVDSFAASSELSLEINKAGRQRMLSQRIVKAYSLVALKISTESSAEELRVSVDVFDDQLTYLKEHAPSAEVTAGLERVEKLWAPFKKIVLADPTKEGAVKLMKKDGDLLFAANDVVKLLVAHSGVTAAETTNIAGRQRMLAQRLSKFYMLKTLGLKDASINAGIEQATNDFNAAHKRLRSQKTNSRYIKTELASVGKSWRQLRSAMRGSQRQPLIVTKHAEEILAGMNEVTSMYAAQTKIRVSRR